MAAPCIFCCVLIVAAGCGVYFFVKNLVLPMEIENFYIIVDPTEAIFETDERFLSVALDTSFMECLFHKLTKRDWEMLEEFSSLLSPGYLRLGGTAADRLIFSLYRNDSYIVDDCEDVVPNKTVIITGKDWIKLNNFANKSNLSLIMDLNVLLRTESSQWNSSNARALIKFSEENGFPLDFQLGNEPNSFPHAFNVSLSPSTLAKDYHALRKILNSTSLYKNSRLIGPEVTRPKHLESSSVKFLREFLRGDSAVDVVSWHQYYLNGRTATLEEFIQPETLDLLPAQIESVVAVVRESSRLPIWISETSSAYGGGAPKLSNRFVASFLWLDKLGMSARMGMSVVIRQSLFKEDYALINRNFSPSPDFWISFFYKNLVGRQVLWVKSEKESESRYLRFYAHCLSPRAKLNGTIVLYGMNLRNETRLLSATGLSILDPIHSFVFRGEYNNLKSKSITLNGRNLVYNRNSIYELFDEGEEVTFPVVVPSYSIGFWVINDVTGKICGR